MPQLISMHHKAPILPKKSMKKIEIYTMYSPHRTHGDIDN